jgi:hypothetical protein
MHHFCALCSGVSNIALILLIPAVGIPLPANFNKQSGPQVDDSDHLSSGNSEIHSVEASKPLVPERGGGGAGGAGAGAGTAFLIGFVCCPVGCFISATSVRQDRE